MISFKYNGNEYPNLLVSGNGFEDYEAYETIITNPYGFYELVIVDSDGNIEFVEEIEDEQKVAIVINIKEL